jgi:hypothetical protein
MQSNWKNVRNEKTKRDMTAKTEKQGKREITLFFYICVKAAG